jgi:hypothetical protein
MSESYNYKSKGMTLLRHLMVRVGRRRKVNPSGVVGLTIGDAMLVVSEFKEMKAQRDEAMRLLGLRTLPERVVLLPHTNIEPEQEKSTRLKESKVAPRWANVIKNLK